MKSTQDTTERFDSIIATAWREPRRPARASVVGVRLVGPLFEATGASKRFLVTLP